MTPARLTQRQTDILVYIRAYQGRRGYPPTRAEIARHFRFRSANAAEQHLRALARKGMLELVPGTSRGLRLLAAEGHEGDGEAGIPIVGRVAAGDPILAAQHIEGYCALGPDLFNPPADYLLRILGESMRDAGIRDGDLIAVRKTQLAEDGAIVIARIDEDVTVKRLRKTGDPRRLQLLPENPEFSALDIDLATCAFTIEGVYVGLIRNRPV